MIIGDHNRSMWHALVKRQCLILIQVQQVSSKYHTTANITYPLHFQRTIEVWYLFINRTKSTFVVSFMSTQKVFRIYQVTDVINFQQLENTNCTFYESRLNS